MTGTFPFGRPATERPPRPALAPPARVFVLGVYPSALHVRWCGSDGAVRVQSLAVDDEPEVFWEGVDARERVERWQEQVGWQRSWGSVTASGNGTSGRRVVDDVLGPLGIDAAEAYFTDCYRRFFVKTGTGSQQAAIDRVYAPFAADRGLPPASLPARPSDEALVRMAVVEDRGALLCTFTESGADLIVTLGQPAADVLADVAGAERVVLRRDSWYGAERRLGWERRAVRWLPLKHPGQRRSEWEEHHRAWMRGRSGEPRMPDK